VIAIEQRGKAQYPGAGFLMGGDKPRPYIGNEEVGSIFTWILSI
jgi:hypothetical protein